MLRVAALLFATLASPCFAQDAATLIADRVELTEERVLIADGNVEIFQGNTRLRASRVTYNGDTDKLLIDGPIELRTGEDTVILANQAELSQGLENGVLRGARLVLDQQLQVAAVELQRVEGRYSQAYKVAATSCHVCGNDRPPLWQIRARRIVHDEEEQQLYFDEAQLRILGIPVFYAPRIRLPGPSLKRATGFLFPKYTSSSLLGWGAKVPYFITFGDHIDLTVTPWITNQTHTLELRYRQAFANGDIDWDTYVSRDDFSNEGIRWGVLAEGQFMLPRDILLKFDIEAVSDRSYFSDYGYSGKDRLDSAVSLERTSAREDNFLEFVAIRSRRRGETDDTFPSVLIDGHRDIRFQPQIGGDGVLSMTFGSRYRASTSSADADSDGLADGVDVSRAGVKLDWEAQTVGPRGIMFGAKTNLTADVYYISDDPSFDSVSTRTSTGFSVSARMPLMHTASNGTINIIEPRAQLAWTEFAGDAVPNEDGTRVEFDEGNLFALNRAPGFDVVEKGLRVDLGFAWTRIAPNGWDSSLTFGRTERLSGKNDFSTSSGLAEDSSNWVISGSLDMGRHFDIIGRTLLDDDFSVTKNELRVGYSSDRLRISGTYAYLPEDAAEDRSGVSSELALTSTYEFNDAFTGSASWRYDFTDDATTRASAKLNYVNECVEIALSVSRNFAASGSVSSNTDFGLTVGLRGFGTGSSTKSHASSCR